MNTFTLPSSCNAICKQCQSPCDIKHNTLNTIVQHAHTCTVCLCKIFPLFKVNDNEFFFMFKDNFREVINKFKNLHFDLDENNDNVDCCRYLEPEEVKEISKNTDNSSILHVNIVSLDKNMDKLRTLLCSLDSHPDIIAVSETRITDNNAAYRDCNLNGYQFIYDNAPPDGRAGGAGLFIKNDLDFTLRNDLKINCSECENIWVETMINGQNCICAAIYRHPRQNFTAFQREIVDKITRLEDSKQIYYLCGDINIDLIKNSTNNGIKFYFDDIIGTGCQVLIDKPTRITKNSASLVDHIYSNDALNKITPCIIVAEMSDHLPIFLKVSSANVNLCDQTNLSRDYSKFKKAEFLKELKTKLDNLSINNRNWDGNAKFNRFIKVTNALVNKYLPLRPSTKKEIKRRQNPWMTNAILKSIKTKNQLYFIKCKYRLQMNINRYKKHRNMLNRVIIMAKQDYYKLKLQSSANKSKAIWSVINEILSKKKKTSSINKIRAVNGQILNQPSQIADAFNTYFGNIGKQLASKIPQTPHAISSARVSNSMSLFNTTTDEVSKLISSLNVRKGNRINDMPTSVLKLSNNVISPFLCVVFNDCMTQGCYPDLLKIAHVVPIFKKGIKVDCSNYRPISLLSNFNRIFEKILYSRTYKYFEKFKLLNFHQYGFRKKHSTNMAIYDILETKLSNRDEGKFTCAVYLDLSKAFDTVDKILLLKKLEHYGIRGTTLKLFESYLTNRMQRTIIDGTLSNLICIELGVPQGSNLGPLLFLIYINDLPGASSLITKMFADDTCLLFSASSLSELQQIANIELSKIANWLTSNKLTLNHTKTKFMIISKNGRNAAINIYINRHQIEQVSVIDYLGITIDSKLCWSSQIKRIESTLSTARGIISKLRHFVNFDCLKSYYFAKVYSKLQYAVLAWGGSNDTKLRRINVIHNDIFRLMTLCNLPNDIRLSHATLYKSLNLLRLQDIYKLELAKFMHKASENALPHCLNNMFVRIDTIHRYPTSSRRKRVYYQNRVNSSAYQSWISTSGISLWQNIEQSLKDKSYRDFSKSYRRHLILAY